VLGNIERAYDDMENFVIEIKRVGVKLDAAFNPSESFIYCPGTSSNSSLNQTGKYFLNQL
jgi:hypothetical protein